MKKKEEEILSETTRKVFLTTTTNTKSLLKSPSSFFLPTIITVKGLYPPFLFNNIPTKSLSVPIKLITMTEHNEPLKKSKSLPISHEFKKPTPIEALITPKKKKEKKKQEEEEDEPMTKPLSITEKRKRQAKRADQVKIWKVREEREARQERLLIRRQLVSGKKIITDTNTVRKKKKRVKFNIEKNSIIHLPLEEE